MPRLLIVSNRLPVTVKSDDGAPAVTPSTGGLATGMSGPHERARRAVDRLARRSRPACPATRARRWIGASRSCGSSPVPLSRGRGRALLRGLLERGPLAALPLLDRAPAAGGARLRRLRGGERAVRRRRRRAVRSRATSSGSTTTSSCCVPRAAPRARPRRADRVLPPHPVPVLRDLPHAAAARAAPRGAARRRPHRLPHRHVRAPLRVGGAPAARRADRGGPDRLATAARSGSACSRWASTRRSSRALAEDPEVARGRATRTARAGRRSSSSASTASTTRRASRAGCSRSRRCCARHPELREQVRLVQVAVPSRENVEAYRELPRRGRRAGRPHQRRVRDAVELDARPLPVPRAVRRPSSSRSTAPPTWCS